MILVLPLHFPSADLERRFLAQDGGGLPQLRRQAEALPGARLLAVADSAAVVQACCEAGLEALHAPALKNAAAKGLRTFFAAALQSLLAAGRIGPRDLVAVGDCSRGQATLIELTQVYRASSEAQGAPVVSMRPCRDHPVQCHVPFRLKGLELFVALEPQETAQKLLEPHGFPQRGYRISRSFPLDWHSLDIWQRSEAMFSLLPDEHSPALRAQPLPGSFDATSLPQQWLERLFLWTGQCAARRVIAAATADLAAPAQMIPAYGPGPGLDIDLHLEPDGKLRVDTRHMASRGLIRLWPLAFNGLDALAAEGVELTPAQGGILLPARGWEGGVLACAIAPAQGSVYDFTEEPKGGESLWSIEPVQNRRVHPVSGKPFANRQEFPPLLELDRPLAAGLAQTLTASEPEIAWLPLTLEEQTLHCEAEQPQAPQNLSPVPLPGALDGLIGALASIEARYASGEIPPSGLEDGPFGVEFRVLDAQLEHARWNYFQIREAFLPESPLPQPRGVGLFPSLTLDRVTAMQLRLREVAQDRWDNATAHPEKSASPLALPRLAAPGPMPPALTRHIASDGQSRFYLSAYSDDYGIFGLYAKDMDQGGRLTPLRQDCVYSGLWFDQGQQLLYALRAREQGRIVFGVDVLDPQGALLRRQDLAFPKGVPPFMASMFSGDATRLYCVDGPRRYILALDKATLGLGDMFYPFGSRLLTNLKATGKHLLSCHMPVHSLVLVDNQGNLAGRHSGPETLYPRLLHVEQDTGRSFVLCVDHPPIDDELQRQRLNIHGPDLSLLRSFDLGLGRAVEVHVMAGMGLFATTDMHQGMQLFDLGPWLG